MTEAKYRMSPYSSYCIMARVDLRRAGWGMQPQGMPLAMMALVAQDMGGHDGRGGVAGVNGINHGLQAMS